MSDQRRSGIDWIEGFLFLTKDLESPRSFCFWTAVSIIAGAVQRKVMFEQGLFTFYANHYIILVSPPGVGKSVLINEAKSMLRMVDNVVFVSDSTSREKLIHDMASAYRDEVVAPNKVLMHSSMTAFCSEFYSLISTKPVDTIGFLTDIHGCPTDWTHTTKHQGTDSIQFPYLNLLAACTDDWLTTSLPQFAVGGGFVARTIWVYEEDKRFRCTFNTLSDEQIKTKELLVNDLQVISRLYGDFRWTDDARAYLIDWYMSQDNRLVDPRVKGFYERKRDHIIKLAMILSLSKDNSLLITKNCVERAKHELELLEPGILRAFAGVGTNKLAPFMEKILHDIERQKEVYWTDLFQAHYFNVNEEEFSQILSVLERTKKIKRVIDPVKKETKIIAC